MIKDKKKIKKKYKLFNFTKRNNTDRKYVDGINKLWWKVPKIERDPKTKKIIRSKHQLDEKSFYDVLKIFFPQHNIIKQEKISNTELFSVIPDFRIELPNATSYNPETEKEDNINGIIFECDGDKHYYSSLRIYADALKMKDLKKLGYRRIRIPFYFQLTEDLTRFIFNGLMFHYTGKCYYSEEKWKEAIVKVYTDPTTGKKLSEDDFSKPYPLVGSPGMHASEYVPSSFHAKGLKRFLKDFKWKSDRPFKNKHRHPDATFPESARHQIIRTLELYIKDTDHGKGGNKNIILPNDETEDGQELHRLYNEIKSSYIKKYLDQVFFRRERYEDIFPELI